MNVMENPTKVPEVPAEPKQPEVKPNEPGTKFPVVPEMPPSHEPKPSATPPEVKPGEQ